jgi:hypothetical protein
MEAVIPQLGVAKTGLGNRGIVLQLPRDANDPATESPSGGALLKTSINELSCHLSY